MRPIQVVRKYNAKLALPDPVCSHAQISENLCCPLIWMTLKFIL